MFEKSQTMKLGFADRQVCEMEKCHRTNRKLYLILKLYSKINNLCDRKSLQFYIKCYALVFYIIAQKRKMLDIVL